MNTASESAVLLVVFLNDNHVSNVRTLQSVFAQSYGNIHVTFCNDATNHFESEKFVINLHMGRPDGIQSIRLQENRHKIGEYLSFVEAVQAQKADYIIVLHSGEILQNRDVIRDIVDLFSVSDQPEVLALSVKQMDDTMAEEELSWDLDTVKEGNPDCWWKEETIWNGLRDSMFVYRGELVRRIVKTRVQIKKSVMQTMLPLIIERGHTIKSDEMAVCVFSNRSVENIPGEITESFGDERLQRIREKYLNEEDRSNEGKASPDVFGMQAEFKKKKSIRKILFRLSRFKKLAVYAVAALLMMLCAILLYTTHEEILKIPSLALAVLGGLMLVITLFMLGCNLYFKLFPERLISYD